MASIPTQVNALWIWHPRYRTGTPGYVLFKREFMLQKSGRLECSFSGDNRYTLYLDGEVVMRGPVRGDLENYYFDTLSKDLRQGRHVLAVELVVWGQNNAYDSAPWSEVHAGGGWLFDGRVTCKGGAVLELSTPGEWLTRIDTRRSHRPWKEASGLNWRIPAPPMEQVRFDSSFCRWQTRRSKTGWVRPFVLGKAWMRATVDNDTDTRWLLTPREVAPLVEESYDQATVIRSCNAVIERMSPNLFTVDFAGRGSVLFHLPGYFTGFCKVCLLAQASGELNLRWTEALGFDGKKAQRDDMSGEVSVNVFSDRLDFGMGGPWEWSPFTYRSGRFLQVDCECKKKTEVMLEFTSWHYPFRRVAWVEAEGMPELMPISQVCWNTVLACAHEHYEDCPFWEQMQYAGDTRIQALISYRVAGDATLGRQAIRQFGNSITSVGLTSSRYPANWRQYIPQFSLIWVLMVFDYYEYTGDKETVHELMPKVKEVLRFFTAKKRSDGLIGNPGFWDVTDWAGQWSPFGNITRGSGKPAAIIALFYATACRKVGEFLVDKEYIHEAKQAVHAVNTLCFDKTKGLYRDVPNEEWYSQHTNAIALLADAVPKRQVPKVLEHLFHDDTLVKCTTYFGAYLLEVIQRYRVGDELDGTLEPWRWVLAMGFETIPEAPSLSCRSDCHAWGASPIGAFVTTLLGVSPAEPGFGKVFLRPAPGKSTHISGVAPIGNGRLLHVDCRRDAGDKWHTSLAVEGGEAVVLLQEPDEAEYREIRVRDSKVSL